VAEGQTRAGWDTRAWVVGFLLGLFPALACSGTMLPSLSFLVQGLVRNQGDLIVLLVGACAFESCLAPAAMCLLARRRWALWGVYPLLVFVTIVLPVWVLSDAGQWRDLGEPHGFQEALHDADEYHVLGIPWRLIPVALTASAITCAARYGVAAYRARKRREAEERTEGR